MFKQIMFALTTTFLVANPTCREDLPEPYASIQLLPFDPHRWFCNDFQLENLFEANEITTVIEVGSWLGLSTRYFGNKVSPKNGKAYAIDNWLVGKTIYHEGNFWWYE